MRGLGSLRRGLVRGFLDFLLGSDRGRSARRVDLHLVLCGRLGLVASQQTERRDTENKGGGNQVFHVHNLSRGTGRQWDGFDTKSSVTDYFETELHVELGCGVSVASSCATFGTSMPRADAKAIW